MGVAQGPSDNLILDFQNGVNPSAYGHPSCKGGQPADDIIKNLNAKEPVGPNIKSLVGRRLLPNRKYLEQCSVGVTRLRETFKKAEHSDELCPKRVPTGI